MEDRVWAKEDRVWASYERHLRLRKLSVFTIKNYRRSAYLVATHTGQPAHQADGLDLEELMEAWLSTYADSTRQHHWVNLMGYFNWAVVQGHIDRNPMRGIPMPEITDDEPPRVLMVRDLKALIAACKGMSMRDRRDASIIRLMCEPGGCRNSEVRLIKVTDVDWSNLVIKVSGKTGTRLVPFGDKTAMALEEYMKARERHKQAASEWLWLTGRQSSHGMNRDTLRDLVYRRGQRAGIGDIYPHLLRHTSADRAMDAGLSTTDMNKLFGWADGSSRMTAVYARGRAVQRAVDAGRKAGLGDRL